MDQAARSMDLLPWIGTPLCRFHQAEPHRPSRHHRPSPNATTQHRLSHRHRRLPPETSPPPLLTALDAEDTAMDAGMGMPHIPPSPMPSSSLSVRPSPSSPAARCCRPEKQPLLLIRRTRQRRSSCPHAAAGHATTILHVANYHPSPSSLFYDAYYRPSLVRSSMDAASLLTAGHLATFPGHRRSPELLSMPIVVAPLLSRATSPWLHHHQGWPPSLPLPTPPSPSPSATAFSFHSNNHCHLYASSQSPANALISTFLVVNPNDSSRPLPISFLHRAAHLPEK